MFTVADTVIAIVDIVGITQVWLLGSSVALSLVVSLQIPLDGQLDVTTHMLTGVTIGTVHTERAIIRFSRTKVGVGNVVHPTTDNLVR